MLGAFLTAIYVLRVARADLLGPAEAPSRTSSTCPTRAAPEWVALVLLGSAIVLFGVWPRLALDSIDPATVPFLPRLTGVLH